MNSACKITYLQFALSNCLMISMLLSLGETLLSLEETLLSLEEGMVEEADNQTRLCYKIFLRYKVFQLLPLVALMCAKATEADPGIFSREGNANTFKEKRWRLVATHSQAPSARIKGYVPVSAKIMDGCQRHSPLNSTPGIHAN